LTINRKISVVIPAIPATVMAPATYPPTLPRISSPNNWTLALRERGTVRYAVFLIVGREPSG
jgi:hypothetical protein